MDLNELKKLAQTDERLREGFENISCPECGHKQRQYVTQGAKLQIRDCPGDRGRGGHILYYDPKGKFLYAVEHKSGEEGWRDPIDHARTEGVTPQTRAWETDRLPRRMGGRKPKKGGKGKSGKWTEYVDPDEEEQ